MIDLSVYVQNDWSWAVLFLMAVFVGMSKTGVQGLAILTVPMLAMAFGAKPSTGLITRMPKLAFVGTNAWFFLCVNFLKLPFQVFAWHNINLTTLAIDACAIPFVLIGAFLGIRLVKFLPEKGFRIFTTTVTIISVLVMLLA